jgi:hypothetical protein
VGSRFAAEGSGVETMLGVPRAAPASAPPRVEL